MYLPLEKYYTLDSANSLYPLCRVSLGHYPPEHPELADFLNQMYPDGLSNHGRNYLYNPGPIMDGGDDNGEGKALLIGLVFELVRRSHFPEKPSRYQSLFACEQLNEVKQFRALLAKERGDENILTAPIYEVLSWEPVHRGDMNLLNGNCPVLELYHRAHLYWSGEPAPVKKGKEEEKPFWELLIPLPVVFGHRVPEPMEPSPA
ncbi:Uncharacterised protein [Escherichia coli]|nr:Uncharacterised protein [Escherichia coli]VVY32902.1 Uncharacterised protein [Escherichia coli]VWM77601.1 Uncharacterised protein [Escherichia coli]